jgi:tetratricopeptide (TPR) repeat protein
MAAALSRAAGAEKLRAYPSLGTIAFFNDYVELYRKDATIPKTLHFEPALEGTISDWNASWSKTNTEYVRRVSVEPEIDLDEAARRLKPLFAGAPVYPDLRGSLIGLVRQSAAGGQMERAMRAAALAADLYPRADEPVGLHGVLLVVSGERVRGIERLRQALAINPAGQASARRLNGVAYDLRNVGQLDGGLEVLKAAVELHPKEANLYDSIGEFHLEKGQKDLSIQWYRKALEVDPNLKTALAALKRLEAGR